MDDDTELEDLTIDELEERKAQLESAGWDSQAAAIQDEIDGRNETSLSEQLVKKKREYREAKAAGVAESDPAMEGLRSEISDMEARLEDPDATERLAQCADVPERAAEKLSAEAAQEVLDHRGKIAEHEAALAENGRMADHTREMREADLEQRREKIADLAGGKTEAAALAPSDPEDVDGTGRESSDLAADGRTREISNLEDRIAEKERRIREHREAGDEFSARYEEGYLAQLQTELAALRPDRDAQAAANHGIETLDEYAAEYRERGDETGAEKMEEHVGEIRKIADGNEQTESASTDDSSATADTLEAPTEEEEEAALAALNEDLDGREASDRAEAVEILKELHDRYEKVGWESNKKKAADRLRKLGSRPPGEEE